MADINMRILIVDDCAITRKIVRNFLKQLNFTNIGEADDGSTALEKLKSDNFNFVITDWNMSKVNGLELLKAIRADKKMKKIPVLMVTADTEKDNVLKSAQAGANDYVVKPFTAVMLKSKIERIFG